MALTRAQYALHTLGALRQALGERPEAFALLAPGLISYAKQGATEREAVETLVTYYWTQVLGRAYHGHQMRHLLLDAGVAYEDTRDVPNTQEPTL